MSFEAALRSYLLLGTVASVIGIALKFVVRTNERYTLVSFQDLRKLSRGMLILGVLVSFIPFKTNAIRPIRSAQIWAGPSMKKFEMSASKTRNVSLLENRRVLEVPIDRISWLLLIFFLIGVFLFLIRLHSSLLQLSQLQKSSNLIKKLGNASIFTSETIQSPLSFVTGRQAIVVLPTYLLGKTSHFSLALRHELEHLRQRDTTWAYARLFIDSLYFWNPLARLFCSAQEMIQEFACDEALLGQKRFSVQAYGGCLLEVAKTMGNLSGPRVGTACRAVERSPSTLKRRIHYMMDSINTKKTKRYIWPVALFLFLGIVSTSVAFQGTIHDRRITMERARELAAKAQVGSDFPITVNERVLKELNRFVGTPDGREYIRASLERMENYKAMVKAKLSDYRLPEELLALPIMESGYQNLPPSANPIHAAGVWQFMAETARRFGLVVNSKKDERLNVEVETDAGCRYLGALYLMLKDWELAILSYNAGENKVLSGIKATGSRNAWVLTDSGFGGDDGYLAKVITAVIILRNPEIAN